MIIIWSTQLINEHIMITYRDKLEKNIVLQSIILTFKQENKIIVSTYY